MRARILCARLERRHTCDLRIRVTDIAPEIVPPKDHDESILTHQLHADGDAVDADGTKSLSQADAGLRRDTTGATINETALRIDRAEIAASGDIVGSKFKVYTGGLQNPAADVDAKRIIAK